MEARGQSEDIVPKERWGVSFCVVTISGKPGSGNTALGQGLGDKYGVEVSHVGEAYRKGIEEHNIPVIDYSRRPVKTDEEIDEMQAQAIRRAIEMTGHPIIKESKLAGVIATEVLDKTDAGQKALSPVARILVVADENVRAERIQKRESEKNPGLEVTQEEIQDRTKNRWKRDLTRYRIIHPQLADIDPWDPESADKFYDFVIDTTDLTPEEAVQKVHEFLASRGMVNLT